MAAPPYANPNEHRAPMKSPSECEWKLGDTEALRDERQLSSVAISEATLWASTY